MLAQIQTNNPEDVRVVFRHFPLISIHDKAALGSQAAEAAGLQGKFWEMHDLLYKRQDEWKDFSVDEFTTWLTERAGELGLDADQFASDLVRDDIVAKVQAAWDHNSAAGLPGTPFLLVNGQIWPSSLPMSQANITAIVKLTLLERQQFSTCPPMLIDPSRQYIATLKTERGDIKIELLPDKAPLAVNNFVFLARQGWYDGITFHRVLQGYIAQAGDPSGTGFGGPGYAFVNEISDLKFDQAGLFAMANAGADTNGSQFFITMSTAPNLDGGYTIFGRVISGMETVQNLTTRDPSSSLDVAAGDRLISVTIEEH